MGENWVYEDDKNSNGNYTYWVKEKEANQYIWADGNNSCDCNRYRFLPLHLQEKHSSECGTDIFIDKIIPLEGEGLPTMELNETEEEYGTSRISG